MIRALFLALCAALFATACVRHHDHLDPLVIIVEPPGPPIDDDDDGDGWTFTEGIDGIDIGPFWYGSAALVVPEDILALVPEGDSVLSYGGPLRFYLAFGFALVEITTLDDLGLLDDLADVGETSERGGKIKIHDTYLRVGKVRIPPKPEK